MNAAPVGASEIAAHLNVGLKAVQRWQERDTTFPAHRWTVGGRPAWDWTDQVLPWVIATGRAGRLAPAEGHLQAHLSSTGQPTLSPIFFPSGIVPGEEDGVIGGDQLPALTSERAAELAQAADRAAAIRSLRWRSRQRKSGLAGPRSRMSPEYQAAVIRQQQELQSKWSVTIDAAADDIDVSFGGQLVYSWRKEDVPTFGLGWVRVAPGHAGDWSTWRKTRPSASDY